MFRHSFRWVLIGCAGWPAWVAGAKETPSDTFYRAFFLDHHREDAKGAAELYEQALKEGGLDENLKVIARQRLAVCREEAACDDFANLAPSNTLVYLEVNRPAEHLTRLFKGVALLALTEESAPQDALPLGISPALIKELLGGRGLAVALTGFNPMTQTPTGVAILHPGRVELLRGLLETALPAGGQPVDSIEGCPTYHVNNMVYVTLTSRLVIVSQQRADIGDAIRRLRGELTDSLAGNPLVADALKGRREGLINFCVNAKPALPLLNAMMLAGASQSREVAMAQTLLDPASLKTLSGTVGVREDQIVVEVDLRLDQTHRNLVFNFLRLPSIDPRVLETVPSGAAAFWALSLNDAQSRYVPTSSSDAQGAPVVTALDLGREVFANVIGISGYILPSVSAEPTVRRPPIPDAALTLTVNDPAKSEAIWNQLLGIVSFATGTGAPQGASAEIEGRPVKTYLFPEGVTVYLWTDQNAMILSLSKSAMGHSIQARESDQSILKDPLFTNGMADLSSDSTLAIWGHAGRLSQLAKHYAPYSPDLDLVAGMLRDTTVSAVLSHSANQLRVSARLTGLPEVRGLMMQRLYHSSSPRRPSELTARPAPADPRRP